MNSKIDPIRLEVLRNGLIYAAEEMGVALKKSAFSPNIKERMDHSCAYLDIHGRILAQAEHIPVHLGSMGWAGRNIIRYLSREHLNLEKGDVLIFNDPYIAGTHLNDITLLMPIFLHKNLVAFTINKAHHADVGGLVPGSISAIAKDLFEEGVVITPQKLLCQGKLNQKFLDSIFAEMRDPQTNEGDLMAQLAALKLGEKRLLHIAESMAPKVLENYFEEILHNSKKRLQLRIEQLAHGTFEAEDYLEDIEGHDLVSIRVKLEVSEVRLTVDFSGTSSMLKLPFNAVFGVTLAATYFAVKSVIDPQGEMNHAIADVIQVRAPEGSLLNPIRPAPVAVGNLETAQRIADTVFRALAQMIPGQVPAACHGSMNNVIMGGVHPKFDREWIFYETNGGGSGARPDGNGVDGIQCNMTNTMNTPIEAIEQFYPLRIDCYEFREKEVHSSLWSGGCGLRREWTLLGESAELNLLGERRKIVPWGLEGGSEGECARYFKRERNGQLTPLKSKSHIFLVQGEGLLIETAGGGDYGRSQNS